MFVKFIPDAFDRSVKIDPNAIEAKLAAVGIGVLFIIDYRLYVKLGKEPSRYTNPKRLDYFPVLLLARWFDSGPHWSELTYKETTTYASGTQVIIPYPGIA